MSRAAIKFPAVSCVPPPHLRLIFHSSRVRHRSFFTVLDGGKLVENDAGAGAGGHAHDHLLPFHAAAHRRRFDHGLPAGLAPGLSSHIRERETRPPFGGRACFVAFGFSCHAWRVSSPASAPALRAYRYGLCQTSGQTGILVRHSCTQSNDDATDGKTRQPALSRCP